MRRSIVLSLLLCSTLTATAHAAVATTAGHVRYAIRADGPWQDAPLTATRSQVVVLLPWQQTLMHRLKAINPHLIVLEYKDLSNASDLPPVAGFSADGVSYRQARAGHPQWLLRDRHGNPIRCRGFPYLWAMDIGNRAYQRAWATSVRKELVGQGWDGVFMDNVDPTIRYYHATDDVRGYPTDAAYAAAMTSALAHITPVIHGAHKLVMANIGSWPSYEAIGMGWLKYLDGGMDERFTKFTDVPGAGYRSSEEWSAELSILRQTQREHKWFMGIAQSSDHDLAAARFGWATMLLGSSGRASFALQNDADYGIETWFSDYNAPIGKARGAEIADSQGVHQRRFANGLVLVNPTATASTVALGGRYSGDGLSAVRRVRIGPHSGLILVSDPAPTRTVAKRASSTQAPIVNIRSFPLQGASLYA